MKKLPVFLLLMSSVLISVKSQYFTEVSTDIANAVGGALEWGDYDNDGDMDLYISGDDNTGVRLSKVYRNDNGVFTDIGADIVGLFWGAFADWGDYDNDGDLDLLVVGLDDEDNGQSKIYKNNNGTFVDTNAGLTGVRGTGVAQWGDYDNDGDLDILVGGFSDQLSKHLTKIYENIDTSFYETDIQLKRADDHKSAGWGDYDDDGDLDIFISNTRPDDYSIIYVNDSGLFTELIMDIASTFNAAYSDWGDFDNDDDLDLAIMGIPNQDCCFPISRIYRNDGNGFTDMEAGLEGLSAGIIKWVDIDMDMDMDLFILGCDYHEEPYCYLYKNTNGSFSLTPTDIPGLNWADAGFGDYDNDNDPDVIISGIDTLGNIRTVKFFRNDLESKIVASDSIICGFSESVLVYYVGDTSNIDSFRWDFDGGTILSGEDNGPFEINWGSIGDKYLSLIIERDPGLNDTLYTEVSVFPEMTVYIGNDTTLEPGADFTLHSLVQNGESPFVYVWNSVPGNSTNNLTIIHDTTIRHKVIDSRGCRARDTITLDVPENAFSEQICMVTVDNSEKRNVVIWERTDGKNTGEYNILKETTAGGIYSAAGTVSFDNEGKFTDNASDPSQHSYRYKIETINSNGYKIGESDFHQTIYLAINQGLPGTYNLIWTPYIGFDFSTYYIYKGSSSGNLVLIDSIADTYNQYTDTASGIAYYGVAVRREQPCNISLLKSTDSLYSEAISNIVVNQPNAVNEKRLDDYFRISPNPFSDELNIMYSLFKPSEVIIEVFDITGMKIYEYRIQQDAPGIMRHTVPADLLNSGSVNIVKFGINGSNYFMKAVRK